MLVTGQSRAPGRVKLRDKVYVFDICTAELLAAPRGKYLYYHANSSVHCSATGVQNVSNLQDSNFALILRLRKDRHLRDDTYCPSASRTSLHDKINTPGDEVNTPPQCSYLCVCVCGSDAPLDSRYLADVLEI